MPDLVEADDVVLSEATLAVASLTATGDQTCRRPLIWARTNVDVAYLALLRSPHDSHPPLGEFADGAAIPHMCPIGCLIAGWATPLFAREAKCIY